MAAVKKLISWNAEERTKVLVAMRPFLAKGLTTGQAMAKAQDIALPPERRKPKATVSVIKGGMWQFITESKGWSEARCNEIRATFWKVQQEQPAAAAVPDVVEEVQTKDSKHKRAYWTATEWARIARRVEYYQRDMGSEESLPALCNRAQRIELPAARRHHPNSLYKASAKGTLSATLKRAGREASTLLAGEPMNYRATSYEEHQALTTPAAVQATTPPPAPAEARPGPILRVGDAFAGMSEPSLVFAQTVGLALDRLLVQQRAAYEERLAAQWAESQAAIVERVDQKLQAALDAQLSGIRGALREVLIAEIGGTAPAPAAEPAEPVKNGAVALGDAIAADVALGATGPRKIKVDIVGLPTMDVARRIEESHGRDFDFRWFDADSVNVFDPLKGREVLLLTTRIPHKLSTKVKSAGIKPIFIKRNEGHITHALDELLRGRGLH